MGIPGIQPRGKKKDGSDREEPVWTGVVPLYDVLDRPVASGLTEEAKTPERLVEKLIEKRNAKHKEYSVKVAKLSHDNFFMHFSFPEMLLFR